MPSTLFRSLARLTEPGPAALCWTLLVGVTLLVPGSAEPSAEPWLRVLEEAGADKLVHFFLFAVLAALVERWMSTAGLGSPFVRAVLVATLYGAATEALQALVPGRSPEWLDLLADAAGGLVGALFFRWLGQRSERSFC